MKINTQGLIDNIKNAAGALVGIVVLRPLGLRFGKEFRGTKWYSTVAANLAADGVPAPLFPFTVFVK